MNAFRALAGIARALSNVQKVQDEGGVNEYQKRALLPFYFKT
ncbi:MAG TPA: hypothetical protein VFQ73_14650 [Flavisolibacter sp.]|nr:hypothetical protein [Flavisolibacter sp.]